MARRIPAQSYMDLRANGSGVKSLSLTIFHKSFLLTPGIFPENEEISTPPPSRFLIGIYLFSEIGSTETFLSQWLFLEIGTRTSKVVSDLSCFLTAAY